MVSCLDRCMRHVVPSGMDTSMARANCKTCCAGVDCKKTRDFHQQAAADVEAAQAAVTAAKAASRAASKLGAKAWAKARPVEHRANTVLKNAMKVLPPVLLAVEVANTATVVDAVTESASVRTGAPPTWHLFHTPLAGFEEFGAGECESSQSSDFWDLGRRFGSSKTNKLVCEQQCKSNECCIAYGINPDDYDNRCYWYDGCAQSATVDKTAGVSVYGKYRSARCYRKIPYHRPPPPVSPNVLDEVEDGMEKDDLGLEIPNQTPTGTSLPTGPNVLDDPVPPPSDGISQLQITGITFLLGLVVYIIIKKNNSKRVQY